MAFLDHLPRRRICYALAFLVCAGLLGYAYYLQFALDEEPCPLCIFQRIAVFGVGVVSLVAAVHNPRGFGNAVYALLCLAISLIGAGIAARHVWLQHLPPDQVPACGPGLGYMLESFPFAKTLRMVLQGSGECAKVGWTFAGMSIPEWTLLFFIGLTLGAAAQFRNRR